MRRLDDEMLVYDRKRARATCLNRFAAEVWQQCDGKTAPEAIAVRVGGSDERAVHLALDQLSRAHLLEARFPPPEGGPLRTNRRELLRALGIGAAAAVPAVTSIVVPRPADAASCLPVGAPCTSNGQCCSGNCDATCFPPV